MTLRVAYRRAAVKEFEEAARWYQSRRRGLGEEFIAEVEQAIAGATLMPQRYPVVFGDVRRAVTRRFPLRDLLSRSWGQSCDTGGFPWPS